MGFRGAVEHQWGDEIDQHAEINLVFEAIIRNFDDTLKLESKELHLEFFWAPKATLASHNLLPTPTIEMVSGPPKSNYAFWGSTLEQSELTNIPQPDPRWTGRKELALTSLPS